jgi:hypothetical protein
MVLKIALLNMLKNIEKEESSGQNKSNK